MLGGDAPLVAVARASINDSSQEMAISRRDFLTDVDFERRAFRSGQPSLR
jgi:hypothetical protein